VFAKPGDPLLERRDIILPELAVNRQRYEPLRQGSCPREVILPVAPAFAKAGQIRE
jgi:hypothetical protein